MNDKICMYCKQPIAVQYGYYPVRVQNFKFQKRETIGYACEDCIEYGGRKPEYKLWKGEKPPHYGASCSMACSCVKPSVTVSAT